MFWAFIIKMYEYNGLFRTDVLKVVNDVPNPSVR